MSHFYVMAIVPQGDDYESKIAPLMAKYDENRDVPEYEKPCYCVGRKARYLARAEADYEVGTIDSLRDSFAKDHPLPAGKTGMFDLDADQDEARRVAWEKHIAPYLDIEKRTLEKHPDRNAPNPKCDECKGTGKDRSTYNPDSKWDWYVEGGRFLDSIPEGGSPVRAILAAWTPQSAPFAILTPDGAWHQRAEMGWFGMTRDEAPLNEWRAKAKAILADYADGHIVVGLDCHI